MADSNDSQEQPPQDEQPQEQQPRDQMQADTPVNAQPSEPSTPYLSAGTPAAGGVIVTPSRPPRPPRRNQRTPRGSQPPTPGPGVVGPSPASFGATPDDASIVNATPAPLTPGAHRRELGVSPIRLTPRTGQTPPTGGTPASPAENAAQTEMVVWGTTINIEDAENRLTEFLKTYVLPSPAQQRDDLGVVATPATPNTPGTPGTPVSDGTPYYLDLLQNLAETGGTVLNIDMSHLFKADQGMYRKLMTYPNELITLFDAVAEKIFAEAYPEEGVAIREKRRKGIQIRTYNLLPQNVQSMRELNPKHISTLVAIRGMVIRASNIIPDIQRAMYRCTKCQDMTDVMISFGRIEEPRVCASCNTRDSYTLIHSRSTFSDKQMVRLQEAPEAIPKGDTPATFTLVMYDSLVDFVKPGDRVEITGILRATPVRVNPKLRVVRSVFRTYIDCVHVRVLNNNQSRRRVDASRADGGVAVEGEEGAAETITEEQKEARREQFETLSCHPALYDRLANSLAPSIFGMTDEKKGVLLQLFGGANKSMIGRESGDVGSDGSARFRAAINILLIGDPGTSKSQLLHSAHRLAPRGVYTSGRGSSAVGLTAYVTKDPDSDDYVLESGALVLSDRGICCIDEFDKMSDYARSVLHEAMEQQTVSIAKAGIIATLNARTAVLAAANPVNSRYDTSKSVVENIDLPPTLLSRFDLIYLVLDAPNPDSDRKLAQHIVSLFYKNYDDKKGRAVTTSGTDDENAGDENGVAVGSATESGPQYGDFMDAKTLTEYIAYCREKVDPRISDSASEALVQGYLDMRAGGRGGGNITATPRQLESLIRLAEAHARMQLKEEVDASDVDEAMRLVKSALHMAAYDPMTGKIDMNLFAAGKSRAADGNIEFLGKAVLEKLQAQPGDSKEIVTMQLLTALRANSDVDISAGDLRNALRRLEEMEQIVTTSGGSMIRLV